VSEFTNHNGILVHPEIYTYDYQGNTFDHVLPNHPDFPAAVEALKALVPEPFEWTYRETPYRYVNNCVEYLDQATGRWYKSERDTITFAAALRYAKERGQ